MKVALIGYGKMGKAIEEIIVNEGYGEVVLKIDIDNAGDLSVENLKKADVAIEFTQPTSAYHNVLTCFEAGIPVVSGTTGWLEQLEDAKKITIEQSKGLFWASNYSLGVNLFFEISRHLAKLMKGRAEYDVSIHEVHHTEKKDTPSGTAITLANDILDIMDRKTKWVNDTPDSSEELAVISYREEDVPGVHLANYESETDSIEIKHTAHSRKGFAAGAVQAAQFMVGKTGYYTMTDLLKL